MVKGGFRIDRRDRPHVFEREGRASAVASLGFAFASRVKSAADFHSVSIGAFTATVVREFGEDTQSLERRAVDRAMHKADQPVLRGLQTILERQLEESRHCRVDGVTWSLPRLNAAAARKVSAEPFTMSAGVSKGSCRPAGLVHSP